MHTYKISFIGAGNVATHLAQHLFKAGHTIVQVYSRDVAHAKALSELVKAKEANDLNKLSSEADVYIISIKDDAISTVAGSLPLKGKVILHTSASVATVPVAKSDNHFGVLYPLQTFSKLVPVDMSKVPVFIDGENADVRKVAKDIASSLTTHVYEADQNKRLAMHVAAVFANNFTNYMMVLSEQVMEKEGFTFDLLKPLIEETFEKLKSGHPSDMQTGPASRDDKSTISKHEQYLNTNEQLLKVYKILTEGIKDLKQTK